MNKTELEILSMIRNHKDPEKALQIAIELALKLLENEQKN